LSGRKPLFSFITKVRRGLLGPAWYKLVSRARIIYNKDVMEETLRKIQKYKRNRKIAGIVFAIAALYYSAGLILWFFFNADITTLITSYFPDTSIFGGVILMLKVLFAGVILETVGFYIALPIFIYSSLKLRKLQKQADNLSSELQ